jgi:hypothetical protein
VVGEPFSKNNRFVPMLAYGLNTLLGRRTIVWRLHSSSRCSFSRVFTPSPKSVPSGSTTAARPPGRSKRMMSARNRSAVSRVWNCFGKFPSIPSSSFPPNGGLVRTTSTRSLEV